MHRAVIHLGIMHIFLMCAVALCGCDDGRPKRVKVSGRVLIDGQPMQHGFVQVLPAGNRVSSGRINSDGTFSLTCYEPSDGCVLGTHPVAVDGRKPLGLTKVQWFAPKRFASAATSGVEVNISGETSDLLIELKTGGNQPFRPFVEELVRGVTDKSIRDAEHSF